MNEIERQREQMKSWSGQMRAIEDKRKPVAAHTPVPWEKDLEDRICSEDGPMYDPNDNYAAITSSQVMAANATFIVRAVNSHDDMLAVMKKVERLAFESGAKTSTDPYEVKLYAEICAAIALAERGK